MWFFARDHSIIHGSLGKRRFAPMYRQSSNTSRILKLVRYYGVIWSRSRQHCEISKKLILNRPMPAKNSPLFLFQCIGRSLKFFASEIPLHASVFSFTYNAVVLLQFRCVHPENQTIFFFRFLHFYISKQMSLTQDLKWSLEQSSAPQVSISIVSNWFVICTVNCFLQWVMVKNIAASDQAFYYTLYLWMELMVLISVDMGREDQDLYRGTKCIIIGPL